MKQTSYEDPTETARRLWTAIGKAQTSDKISDLVKQFMDLDGVPEETLDKLRERLDAKALEIREAEKAA